MFKIRTVTKKDRGGRKHGEVDKVSGEENDLFKKTPCHLILAWKTKFSFQ